MGDPEAWWRPRLGRAWALAAAMLLGGAALAEGRVALLIGNSTYANAAFDLRNPANDATALAEALGGLGFETEVLIDADRAAGDAALAAFAREAAEAEVALFFFAGHGVQIEGANYLLGSGFSELSREGISREAVSLDAVRVALAEAGPELALIVLDACRNNPLAEGGLAARGLARAQGGAGLLIAYATDPGNVAYDGLEANSVFSSALIDHIATPGLEVRLMFGRVRQDVVLASGGLQVPWVEEAVLGEHVLKPGASPSGGAPAVAEEVALWQEATQEGTAAGYRRYLERYPAGLFQAIGEERVARLEAAPAPVAKPGGIPAGANRGDLVAALTTLGYLAPARAAQAGDIEAAFGSYAGQTGGSADLDALYLDAAQVAVMLGGATAQRIRTDVAALAGIETALGSATRARGELAALAASSAEARAALGPADADIAAMREARERVLERLDRSRSYYAELVERSGRHFRPYLARSLPGLLDRTRGAGGVPESRLVEDAGRFVEHATADGVARAEGSYAWLADFLPRN
jgi:hypothetical protein